jgi:hypothetical protein
LASVKRRPDAVVPAGLVWRFTLLDQAARINLIRYGVLA